MAIEFGSQHSIGVSPDGRTLKFNVPSCDGKPTVRVIETPSQVHLRVRTDTGGSHKCADSATVTLRAPLGKRVVIDDKTGATVATAPLTK